MKCTVCGSFSTRLVFLKNEFRVLSCAECDHTFTEISLTEEKVNEIYSDNYFKGGGYGYDDYNVEKEMLINRGAYYANKLNKFIIPGKVLDIGSAAGFILKGFENKGWQGTGIEPNKSMVEYGLKYTGVNIINGTIETVELDEQFDLVIMIQVIAHLYDLDDSLRTIYTHLKPEGHVLVETWDKDSFTAKLFGKNWHEYSPPSTLNYFSKRTLADLMSRHNFTLVSKGTPKKRIHSKHAKSLLKDKLLAMPGLKWLAGITNLIPDNKLIPYPAEDLFWALFSKNI
jgi:2-polyprenyl-3-methyl-5-hydroxy-6-metoxy-1,4-benzoquinol methylase